MIDSKKPEGIKEPQIPKSTVTNVEQKKPQTTTPGFPVKTIIVDEIKQV